MGKKRIEPEQGALELPVPEGVHLDMPDAAYFDAAAIGSSDLKTLYWQPESWFYKSWFNHARRVKARNARKAALDLGTALHDLVLLGEDAFQARFTFEPDEDRGDWIRTPLALKKELKRLGKSVDNLYGRDLMQAARRAGIAGKVWDLAWVDFESARKFGRPYLTEAETMRIRHTARLILEHAEIGPALRGPSGLSEVAVFWRRAEDPKTLLRAKFDRVTYQRMFDLKTLGNWRGRDIDAAIADAIDQQDYGIQRVFYHEAFAQLIRFVEAGAVHAWADDGGARPVVASDREILARIAAGGPAVWVWVFVQLRSDVYGQERAPMVIPRFHKPEGRIWAESQDKIEAALRAYRTLRDQFGPTPWAKIDEVKQLTDSDIRSRVKRELE